MDPSAYAPALLITIVLLDLRPAKAYNDTASSNIHRLNTLCNKGRSSGDDEEPLYNVTMARFHLVQGGYAVY